MTGFPLFPDQASTIAGRVDAIYFVLVGITVVFSTVIFVLIFYFALKYSRKAPDEIPPPMHGSLRLELAWSIIPLFIALSLFAGGTAIYFRNADIPPGAMEIFVVGKQWMWKLQHPSGAREINELHVPVGQAVKLTMTSEDVIHSFYVPAFRVKMDVIPGRYTTLWFQPTKPGKYHLFCAEYCGTNHSAMVGWIHVMEQVDFNTWLGGGSTGDSMAESGERLFNQLGCVSCHRATAPGRGPVLNGLYGTKVPIRGGQPVVADEAYIRESILHPQAKVVSGFLTQMPTFEGQVTEEGLLQLIAYIKSLAPTERIDTEQ